MLALYVETNNILSGQINEMSKRKISLAAINQPGITQFVERENKEELVIKFIGSKRSNSQSGAIDSNTIENASSTERATKKRIRPEVSSPDSSAERHPNKRKTLNMEPNVEMTNNTHEEHVDLKPELRELKRQLFAGIEQLIEPLKQDIRELKAERNQDGSALCVETVNRKFRRNEAKQKKIEDRLSVIEDQLLEKNLIFQGLHETEYEDQNEIKGKVIRAIASTMPGEDTEEQKTNARYTSIDQVERIGRYNPLRSRPVKVKFTDKSDVDHLLKNKKNLPQGVYVDKEYSKATEKERRLLRPVLKAARRMTKYKKKCRMEGSHVVLDGIHYYRENIHTLPPELAADKVTSETDKNTIAFFGELNPLSNFHSCRFDFEDETFHSTEQLIQLKKAELFEDNIAKERILNSTDAQDSKEIAMDIANFEKEKWNNIAETLCYEGIRQKFIQNPTLMDYLLETGNKTIVEATYDNVWGTGKPLGHEECLNPTKWRSVGILGRILMKIRDSYLSNAEVVEHEEEPMISNAEEIQVTQSKTAV